MRKESRLGGQSGFEPREAAFGFDNHVNENIGEGVDHKDFAPAANRDWGKVEEVRGGIYRGDEMSGNYSRSPR